MKKLSLFLAALLTAIGMNLQAAEIDIWVNDSLSKQLEWSTGTAYPTFDFNEYISAGSTGSDNGTFYVTDPNAGTIGDWRVYEKRGNKFWINAKNGAKITKVAFTYSGAKMSKGGGVIASKPIDCTTDTIVSDSVLTFEQGVDSVILYAVSSLNAETTKIGQGQVRIHKFYIEYTAPEPDMHDFLYFVGLNGNDTVKLNKIGSNYANLTATFEYSTDRTTWNNYTWPDNGGKGGYAIALENAGDTVFFRAKGTKGLNATVGLNASTNFTFAFGADDQIAAGGNVMSLYDATCEQDTTTAHGFYKLFNGAKQLVSASELKLTATQLAAASYGYMFSGCTSLTQAPELKATTLANTCYRSMFQNCTTLQVDTCADDAQCTGALLVVPATGATNWNYKMFDGCKGTVTTPQLNGHYCIKEYVPVIEGVTLTGYNAAYDGQNHSVQVSGTIAGDVIEFSADSATWSATNPSFKNVVDTLIYVRVQRAGYQDWGGKATIKITPKEINVTGTSVDLKEYDGTTTASFIDEGELEGVIAGDDVTVSATGEFEDKNAGDDKEVTITYTLSGTDAPNYILKSASTTMSDLVIFARSIDVNTDVVPKIYDGNTDATVNAVLINVIEGDDVTVSATGEFEDANVGFNEVHVTFILSGDDAGNYQLQEEEKTAYGEITAREITMTSASDSKQFDGDPLTNATITFSGDGFVGSDTVSCTVTGSQTAVGSSPNTFTYTFSGSSEDNYAFTKVEGTLEVTAAPGPVVETYGRKLKTAGNFGTICLAKKFTSMEGVEGLYVPASKDASKLYCEEVNINEVEAGKAYIFKAEAGKDSVTFVLDGEAVLAPVVEEGDYMIGWLKADSTLTAESDYYGLNGNTISQLAAGSKIKQNCAVIDLDNVPAATSAPSRRYVAFGINGTNTTTGVVDVNATRMSDVHKFVNNGQLIIIRDGKKFNAQGQEL